VGMGTSSGLRGVRAPIYSFEGGAVCSSRTSATFQCQQSPNDHRNASESEHTAQVETGRDHLHCTSMISFKASLLQCALQSWVIVTLECYAASMEPYQFPSIFQDPCMPPSRIKKTEHHNFRGDYRPQFPLRIHCSLPPQFLSHTLPHYRLTRSTQSSIPPAISPMATSTTTLRHTQHPHTPTVYTGRRSRGVGFGTFGYSHNLPHPH
jgi:hypothetical protein